MSSPASGYQHIALDLARVETGQDGRLGLHVVSCSMLPLLRPGDLVQVRRMPVEALRQGDVIVVNSAGNPITHRLVMVDAQGWHTKGDSCTFADPPVPAEAIWGRVVSVERGDTCLDLQNRRWSLVNRCVGALSCWQVQVARHLGGIRLAGWPFRVMSRLVLEVSLRV